MPSALEWTFWIALVVGIYPYVLYPLFAAVFAKLQRRAVRAAAISPRVSIVISAYNEVRHIEATVRNKIAQDYPAELLEILVVSDGSTDGTDELMTRLAQEDSRVTFIRQDPRRGKTAALNLALARVQGEIVVFSDANSIYQPDTVRKLVTNFADPTVGYVTGKMIYVNPDGSIVGDGCSALHALRELAARA